MDKYIGKLLDNRYEILQLIGTGGMAKVYKARCHRLNRLVAVKILKDEFAKDDEFRNRFHAESHAVAMLSHTNIVAVYDVSRSNSVEYIVMELIDGMTLKQYIEHKGTLSVKEAMHFTAQILRALSHAHGKGIIHRDIKPHNIMLLRDGTIKVTDFGIARFAANQRTLTNEALGSVHYISPEQAKGGDIDARTDIYSTGVMLYEMITGRLPYEGDTPVSVAIQHINSMPLSPRDINPEIPEALEMITMRAMSASLSKRYASCEDMLSDLEEFRKNPNLILDYDEIEVKGDDSDGEDTRKIGAAGGSTVKYRPGDAADDEDDFDADDDDRSSKLPVIAGILAAGIFLSGVIALLITVFSGGSAELVVPDMVGKSFEEIIEDEAYEMFRIVEDGREFNSEFEEGEIISQKPDAGDSVKENAEILVVISRGTKMVSVPDVMNMTEKQARIELKNEHGLEVKIEYETSEDVLEGYVIRTEPAANDEIAVGDTVTVFLSKGKEIKNTKVPDLYGMTQEQAVRELENSNLVIGDIKEIESDRPKGTVVSQSTEKNAEVEEKSAVSIQISMGKEEPAKKDTPKEEKPVKQEKPSKDVSTDNKADDKSQNSSTADNKPQSGMAAGEKTDVSKPTEGNVSEVSKPVSGSASGDTETKPEEAEKLNNEKEDDKPENTVKSKTIPIKLPASPENFTLTVKVNGNTVYSKSHSANDGTANVTISGEGTVTVSVYVDDKLFNEISVTF